MRVPAVVVCGQAQNGASPKRMGNGSRDMEHEVDSEEERIPGIFGAGAGAGLADAAGATLGASVLCLASEIFF